jgi:hypothetical protein
MTAAPNPRSAARNPAEAPIYARPDGCALFAARRAGRLGEFLQRHVGETRIEKRRGYEVALARKRG